MDTMLSKRLNKKIEVMSAPWLDEQLVRLGNYSNEVLSDEAGMYYARQYNGEVIKVYNGRANAPATFDLHVRVGREKSVPDIWQIIRVQQDYTTPAEQGYIAPHHKQHEFNQPDMVYIDRRQILQLTVLVSDAAGFIVTVFGSIIRVPAGLAKVETQSVDLSSYVVTTGAKFVNIECDDSGVISVNAGTAFSSPMAATVGNIPAPDPDKFMIATVLLYEGQVELLNTDIAIPYLFFGGGASSMTVEWGNVGGILSDQIDLVAALVLKSDTSHTHGAEGIQLLMEDGVTFPPVPLTNEDGTDWIYND